MGPVDQLIARVGQHHPLVPLGVIDGRTGAEILVSLVGTREGAVGVDEAAQAVAELHGLAVPAAALDTGDARQRPGVVAVDLCDEVFVVHCCAFWLLVPNR